MPACKMDKLGGMHYYYYIITASTYIYKYIHHSIFFPKKDMVLWSSIGGCRISEVMWNIQDTVFTQQKKTQENNDLFILTGVIKTYI